MMLLADSGSTKTHWAMLSPTNKVSEYTTLGLNPHLTSEHFFDKVLAETFQFCKADIKSVYFYGSGCATAYQALYVKNRLERFFSQAHITVNSDVCAAAKALLGNAEGYIAILGTGSACAYYNGNNIQQMSPSLGYIIGDEGSGAALGKELLKAFFYNKLPPKLATNFSKQYALSRDEVLQKLYHQPRPNAWLASFAPFLKENLNDAFAAQIVFNAFNDFFNYHIKNTVQDKNKPLACMGSVAWHFKEILIDVACKHNHTIFDIQKDAIHALVAYHKTDSMRANQ
ncbi:MAG: hypothetical protein WCQ95_03870 [Bacteroidota bacterium]